MGNVEISLIRLTMKSGTLLVLLILFRNLNCLCTQTFFQADEFWQALEPAHKMAFGYGSLTWEWEFGIRSYAFPLIFEVVYRLVKVLAIFLNAVGVPGGTDAIEYQCVVCAPKIVMSIISATGEYYTCLFVEMIYNRSVDKSAIKQRGRDVFAPRTVCFILSVTNFFNGFFITRTFINSFEMALTAIALYYWDWALIGVSSFRFFVSLTLAMFCCLQRPSNGLIWIVLGGSMLLNLWKLKQYQKMARSLINVIVSFVVAMVVNCSIDYYFYGKLTFPIFRFIKFNFTTPLSRFYGTAPWHFHLVQSLPILLGFNIIFFAYAMIFGNKSYCNNAKVLLLPPLQSVKLTIVLNLVIFSLLSHKEFRFVYQLQPLFMLMSTIGCMAMIQRIPRLLCYLVPLCSVVAFITIDYYHESGSISVMKYLHGIKEPIDSVGFVMPCHSTPWQSYLHRNDIQDLWAITCEPPLHLLNDKGASSKLDLYMDESDHLYDNVATFMTKYFDPVNQKSSFPDTSTAFHRHWPTYLVLFQHLDDSFMKQYLQESSSSSADAHGYSEHKRFFNSLSHWDSRRQGDIVVYKRSG